MTSNSPGCLKKADEEKENEHLHCSSYSSTDVTAVLFTKLSKTKIRNFGIEVPIKQYIASFDVSVDNSQSGLLMKISQSSSYAKTDLVSCWPIQFQFVSCIFT